MAKLFSSYSTHLLLYPEQVADGGGQGEEAGRAATAVGVGDDEVRPPVAHHAAEVGLAHPHAVAQRVQDVPAGAAAGARLTTILPGGGRQRRLEKEEEEQGEQGGSSHLGVATVTDIGHSDGYCTTHKCG